MVSLVMIPVLYCFLEVPIHIHASGTTGKEFNVYNVIHVLSWKTWLDFSWNLIYLHNYPKSVRRVVTWPVLRSFIWEIDPDKCFIFFHGCHGNWIFPPSVADQPFSAPISCHSRLNSRLTPKRSGNNNACLKAKGLRLKTHDFCLKKNLHN